jgi:hypothetical protein
MFASRKSRRLRVALVKSISRTFFSMCANLVEDLAKNLAIEPGKKVFAANLD